jgi:hypothetical protein
MKNLLLEELFLNYSLLTKHVYIISYQEKSQEAIVLTFEAEAVEGGRRLLRLP